MCIRDRFAATGRWLLAATIAMGVALFFVYDVLLGRLKLCIRARRSSFRKGS